MNTNLLFRNLILSITASLLLTGGLNSNAHAEPHPSQAPAYVDAQQLTEVPKDCSNIHPGLAGACEVARQYNITLETSLDLSVLASAEMTANMCGFKHTDSYIKKKAALTGTAPNNEIYVTLLRMFYNESATINRQSWCPTAYGQYGPRGMNRDTRGNHMRFYK